MADTHSIMIRNRHEREHFDDLHLYYKTSRSIFLEDLISHLISLPYSSNHYSSNQYSFNYSMAYYAYVRDWVMHMCAWHQSSIYTLSSPSPLVTFPAPPSVGEVSIASSFHSSPFITPTPPTSSPPSLRFIRYNEHTDQNEGRKHPCQGCSTVYRFKNWCCDYSF